MQLPSREVLKLVGWIAASTVTVGGAGWRFVEARYVHQTAYDRKAVADSLEHERDDADRVYIRHQVDSANIRLQQIICGRKIEEGCR